MLDGTRVEVDARPVLLCFSHLRWDFVFQRPQHLLSRAAREFRVLYWEEPAWTEGPTAVTETLLPEGVIRLQPLLPTEAWEGGPEAALQVLLDQTLARMQVHDPVLWFYTPRALAFAGHLRGRMTVYDCMDELAAFKDADTDLPEQERALLARADVVFTGGASLFEAKRALHHNVHLFPSGVDTAHFTPARSALTGPADQAAIPHPRLGFYGVLDERLDRALLAAVADRCPDMHFILLGPIAKLEWEDLPQRANIHYLGPKNYSELPSYLAGWDVALMPFAVNESTRYISPTKTPEYLAAGRPVVSTPVPDVVRQYGACDAVQIAGSAPDFAAACERALTLRPDWGAVNTLLAEMGWDAAWGRIRTHIVPAPFSYRSKPEYDVLIVGAGFAGSVLAERLARGSGQRVLIVDRRPHIGGNAYDRLDEAGILTHPYGPHIFHTNSQAVLDYLSAFTAWRPYEHRVLAAVRGQLLPVPINRTTVNRFFGLNLSPDEVAPFLAHRALRIEPHRTSADVVLGTVGTELYEAFFRGYTRKQWGLDPSELDRSVTARVPTRTSDDDRYFLDRFQCMPLHGFTRMFERMLDHPNITVATGVDYTELSPAQFGHIVFTGPVDEYFGYRFGPLPYRSLRFEHRTLDVAQHQPVAVVNYPDETVPYTRVTEFKHLTGQVHARTSVCLEYPSAEGDPYYPVPRPENAALYRRYQALADAEPRVSFVGRLATYKYYNMDQVAAQALSTYDRLRARVSVSTPERAAAE